MDKDHCRVTVVPVTYGATGARSFFTNETGLADELHVDIMPVFLGSGLRSFESASLERVRLEKISVQEAGARTSLRFRVKR
ncbi:MAG TPA: hypothetical protein VNO32_20135 [Candidatus Acidoferrum sp.]|nr:hypothetical protein [Candidatus Acidoferrum sp.]